MEQNNSIILLVDGECALCHRLVRWILKHEKPNSPLMFGSLQDAGFKNNELQSVILISNNTTFKESDVLLQLKPFLNRRASFGIVLLSILPGRIRNFFYRLVAKHRYKWFGKIDPVCNLNHIKKHRNRWITASQSSELSSIISQ